MTEGDKHALGEGRRENEGRRKREAQGPTLSHTVEQEVFNGNTLPSCERTIPHLVSHHKTHVTNIIADSAMLCIPLYVFYTSLYWRRRVPE